MSKIGVLCPNGPGHLNPMIAVAHELENRGHSVTFYQQKDARELVEDAGFQCRTYGEKEYPVGWAEENTRALAAR